MVRDPHYGSMARPESRPAPRLHAVSWTPGAPPRRRLPDPTVLFRAVPEPDDPPAWQLDPPWEALRAALAVVDAVVDVRPAAALARVIDVVVARERTEGASAITFADLHHLLTPILCPNGETHA